jgi:hypothetical protein
VTHKERSTSSVPSPITSHQTVKESYHQHWEYPLESNKKITHMADLSKEEIRTIADIRRNVWTAGFQGLAYGSIGGYLLHTATRLIHNSLSDAVKGKLILPGSDKPIRFTKNTAFFSFMAGGTLCSFILASTTGKNQVHQMHDIFEIGKKEYKTPYQQASENAKLSEVDPESREKRRLSRRKTVSRRLTEGQGLSDSHSGTWVKQGIVSSEEEQRRSDRRRTMANRLDDPNRHGLSDSHGGKWKD